MVTNLSGIKYLVLIIYKPEKEKGLLHFTQLFCLGLNAFGISPDKGEMSDQEVSRKVSDGWSAHAYPHESLPEHFQLFSLYTAHFNASKAEPFPESSRLPKDTGPAVFHLP